MPDAVPAIAMARGPTQGGCGFSTNMYGRGQALYGLGLKLDRRELVKLSLVSPGIFLPQALAHAQHFVEAAAAGARVHPRRCPFSLQPTRAHTDLRPPAGHNIQRL